MKAEQTISDVSERLNMTSPTGYIATIHLLSAFDIANMTVAPIMNVIPRTTWLSRAAPGSSIGMRSAGDVANSEPSSGRSIINAADEIAFQQPGSDGGRWRRYTVPLVADFVDRREKLAPFCRRLFHGDGRE